MEGEDFRGEMRGVTGGGTPSQNELKREKVLGRGERGEGMREGPRCPGGGRKGGGKCLNKEGKRKGRGGCAEVGK